ncbi:hypothetical protein PanWU01x14_102110 [Parasponia andersonii]|uniref:Uncharacterized protein n=1 Tax=Parasponia andersonii TaxID=3476 RepID=A0A2P5D2S5_PARAD|nr:hypothetical protein PanWU01x14_102110 [Parasponia andersonii]
MTSDNTKRVVSDEQGMQALRGQLTCEFTQGKTPNRGVSTHIQVVRPPNDPQLQNDSSDEETPISKWFYQISPLIKPNQTPPLLHHPTFLTVLKPPIRTAKCFRFQQPSHHSNECLQHRRANLIDGLEEIWEEEEECVEETVGSVSHQPSTCL